MGSDKIIHNIYFGDDSAGKDTVSIVNWVWYSDTSKYIAKAA